MPLIKKIGNEEDLDTYYQRMRQFELDPKEIFDIVDEISFGENINAEWDKKRQRKRKNSCS
ncbi:hypothetical protein [Methanobrevibacter arboriphilus]|uniref:hypothetical protein n=1 Tax=Methanobrevibacter arboriphilus TaxID=39441 RepID=UPI001CDB2455|nr:hypothetical protein [Methanobrevibacter arboriphilus]